MKFSIFHTMTYYTLIIIIVIVTRLFKNFPQYITAILVDNVNNLLHFVWKSDMRSKFKNDQATNGNLHSMYNVVQ